MKIDFYGDSFTYGYDGANNGGRVATPFPQYVQNAMPQHVIRNAGVNSNDTTKALAGTDGVHPAWATQMAATDADVVVIGLCFNDSNAINTTQYQTNLNTMYTQAVAAGKLVVFMTPHVTTFTGVSAFASTMSGLAASLNIGCIDLYNWSTQYFTTTPVTFYVPDGYHPNQTTYNMIGKQVSLVLNDCIANLASPLGQNQWLYERTFYDEFDGVSGTPNAQGLDTQKWVPQISTGTDDSVKNYQVSSNALKIWPDAATFTPRYATTDPSLVAGGFAQKYGYFEAKIQSPTGKGCWNIFYLYNHTDNSATAYRPEIDVMTTYGSDVNLVWANGSNHPVQYAGTVHPLGQGVLNDSSLGNVRTSGGVDFSAGYHIFGVKWDATGTQFYLDGAAVGAITPAALQSPFDTLYFTIGLKFGDVAGAADGTTPTGIGNSLAVDYVRAWQHIDYAVPPTGQPGVLVAPHVPTLVFADRVKETATANGTGAPILTGPLLGHQGFTQVCSVGDTFDGVIEAVDQFGNPTGSWETGIYTYQSGGTVARTTVQRSSNNNGLVNFGSSLLYVYLSVTAYFARNLKQTVSTSLPPPTTVRPYVLNSSGQLVDTTATFGNLQFSDEFTGASLDTSVWNTTHMNNISNVKNYDTLTYIDGAGVTRSVARLWPQQDPSLPNITTSNGGDPQNQFFRRELSTTGPNGFGMLYGFLEYRAKLCKGAGIFPGLWQFNDGPQDEVDTMEAYGNADGFYADANYNITDWTTTLWHPGGGTLATNQYGYTKAKDALNGGQPLSPPVSGAWHTWGCAWDQTNITFYYDGKQYFTFAHNGGYSQPQYLIFQLWFGFIGHTSGVPTAANTPQGPSNAFELDWVRVWPLGVATPPPPPPPPPPAGTPTRYVATTGSDTNAGTQAAPWRTIAKAAASAVAGDIVAVLDGTYVENSINFLTSGTQAQPITFMSLNKWGAIVSSIRASNLQAGFSVSASWITLKDFVVRVDASSPPNSIYTSSNCDIRAWTQGGVVPSAANDTTGWVGLHVSGIKFLSTSADRAEGIKSNQDFSLIENCVMNNAIEIFNNQKSIVRYNTFNALDQGGSALFCKGGIRSAQIYGNVIFSNFAEGTTIYLGGTTAPGNFYDNTAQIEAYNCIAHSNVIVNQHATASIEALEFCGATNCAFVNNVVVGKATVGSRSSPNNLVMSANPKLVNNIFKGIGQAWTGGTPSAAGWNFTGAATVDYNDFFNFSSGPTQVHGLTTDPLFVNSASDWHLQAGSPCIGTGTVFTFTGFYGENIDVTIDAGGANRVTPWALGVYK